MSTLPTTLHQSFCAVQLQIADIQRVCPQTDIPTLMSSVLATQQLVRERIEPLLDTIEDLTVRNQVRSLYTEIVKQLKLLATDAQFLAAARQETTIRQRQQQFCDRCNKLLAYCASLVTS